ncbi:MAG: NAD(P)-dependent glycerol-3-phosphate dehydrogenase [Clostridiales Family XIII bacterium]|jgi:glycerol-3-phosphate dehydrogenase (NAD(P)+)|nr:NAD(P)-dependent glycerol-3-phosphate dehydrogenase [Clostridiales Family XIII bacterium]
MKAGIIGAGSWGTALSNLLAGSGVRVCVWDVDQDLLDYISRSRENKKYLPGHRLHDLVEVADSLKNCVKDADFAVAAVPAQHFRSAAGAALPDLRKDAFIVNVAKGIEIGSLQTISRVCAEIAPGRVYAVLSGPSHAEEVADGMPTTVTAASADPEAAEAVQNIFMTERFRVYTQGDVLGVELGGALKNIIALGAGISDGMGYGDNTKAALMTRGISEMARLGARLGARRETFFGLSGIGDLIVTCTSMHSRNRRCGIMIGEGMPPKDAMARVGMVVEGIPTAEAASALAGKLGVEMPITEAICRVVGGDMPPDEALSALMTRSKKHEQEDLGLRL